MPSDRESGVGSRKSGVGSRESGVASGAKHAVSPTPDSRLPTPELWVQHLGTLPYAEALDYQREVARARISGAIAEDVMLLVEHPPVITLGRSAKERHLLATPEFLAQRGVELYEVERGGDVTFHGPGQLVGYPIIDLKRHRKDLHWYLRQVEESLIVALAELGIDAERKEGLTGVWVGGGARKIASIGVHARDWVTWHGFALNVTTDLSYFDLMVPCGIQAVRMTSVAAEAPGAPLSMQEVESAVVTAFGRVFKLDSLTLSDLGTAIRRPA